jgi:hypothetical protein
MLGPFPFGRGTKEVSKNPVHIYINNRWLWVIAFELK